MADLTWLSLREAGQRLRRRELRAVELAQAYLDRARQHNPELNAYLLLDEEGALEAARALDAELDGGRDRGPLHGIPIAVKDLFDVRGLPTTAGSPLNERVPEADAFCIARLRQAGCVFLGKAHLHEWAYGVTNESPHFGPARNPWDPSRVTGGSSGGSGAAVAARLCAAATGSDTGGSIRIPAAHCGVVGVKPTFGRVSTAGLVPLARSLDHPGVLARSVPDAALLLAGLAGYDPGDPTSKRRQPLPDRPEPLQDLKGWRAGFDPDYVWPDLHPAVRAGFEHSLEMLEGLGAHVEEAHLAGLKEAEAACSTILMAEASAYHRERLERTPEAFGPDVRRRLEKGLEHSGTDVARAYQLGPQVRRTFVRYFEGYDLFLTPAVPIPATPIGGDPLAAAGLPRAAPGPTFVRFTRLFNIAGLPTVNLPCGVSEDQLPVSVQLVGAAWGEARLLGAAAPLEEALAFELPDLPRPASS